MKRSLTLLISALLSMATATPAQWTSSRPDGHAPIAVMLDHIHEAGEFMLSYRYMYMKMNGIRVGTDDVDFADVVDPDALGFMVTPTDMMMQMHMFGLMFAPTDRLTLVAMLPLKVLEMDHLTAGFQEFTTESSGIGDVSVAGMWGLDPVGDQRVHIIFAASLPSGSIDEKDQTPMSGGDEIQLPYPMQLGSGTVDVSPGATYLGQAGDWSWGLQALPTFRLGENDNEYRLGHRYFTTAWGARRVSHWLSGSLRLDYQAWDDVEGADTSLSPAVVPTAVPSLQGGQRWSAGFGVNTYLSRGALRGLRLAGELIFPFYQDVDGPQLETDWVLLMGAQYSADSGLIR